MRAIVGAAIVACLCATARAEDRAKARTAYDAAKQHYKLGEYREAQEGFKEAYRNYENPIFIFDLAQCQRQLGEREEAIHSYRMFLVEKPDAPNRRKVEDMIATLEKQRASPPTPASAPGSQEEPPIKQSAPPTPSAPKLNPLLVAPPTETPSVKSRPTDAPVTTPPRETPAPALATVESAPPPFRKPVYKRWWLWTAVGAVVVVGVVGISVAATTANNAPIPANAGSTMVRF
jgi:tetratricopeptide (TPR) repeat protein